MDLASCSPLCNGTGLQVNYLQADQSLPQPNKLPLSSLWNEKKTQICWVAALLYVKELQVVLQQSYRVRQQSYSETSNQTNSFSSLCSRASCIVRQSNCLQADQSSPPAKKASKVKALKWGSPLLHSCIITNTITGNGKGNGNGMQSNQSSPPAVALLPLPLMVNTITIIPPAEKSKAKLTPWNGTALFFKVTIEMAAISC